MIISPNSIKRIILYLYYIIYLSYIINEENCSLRCWSSAINIIYINFRFKGERSSSLCLMELGVRSYVTPLINALYFGLYLQETPIP